MQYNSSRVYTASLPVELSEGQHRDQLRAEVRRLAGIYEKQEVLTDEEVAIQAYACSPLYCDADYDGESGLVRFKTRSQFTLYRNGARWSLRAGVV